MEIEKLKHVYEIQLEELKAEMTLTTNLQHEVVQRKLKSYPKLVELVYRTRNIARELANNNVNPVLADEFQARAHEVENLLYESRIDLEADSIFLEVHEYKNLIKTFSRMANDINIMRFQETQEKQISETRGEMSQTYERIESSHKNLINLISAKSLSANFAVNRK